ncbi:type VI secretion system amidase effector protein Tae4 [Aliikangiella maris]|uniref:Type VI secretion system amidase effector protein Tae4 n=2 Tax=Aliikangiella maris TaxID=3162458 RepID=A0ABV3MHM7_9GAMM
MKFKELWDNHPTVSASIFSDDAPCLTNGARAFTNQCAIRLGVSLEKAGVDLKSFKGVRCWHGHKPSHILRAEELAKWLKSSFSPFNRIIEFKASEGFKKIYGKKGIIFFKDYYGENNQGDHIDLWNINRLTKFSTWFEFNWRDGEHYEKATIWFWPIQ